MSSLIASNKNLASAQNAPAGSLPLGDLASRMAAQQVPGTGLSFAQLMSQHQAAEQTAPKPAARPQAAAQQARNAQATPLTRPAVQPRVPVRTEPPPASAAAPRPADKPVGRPEGRGQKPAAAPREAGRTDAADKTVDGGDAEQATDAGVAGTAASAWSTQAQPNGLIQPGDAHGLMAWLSSQAAGDADTQRLEGQGAASTDPDRADGRDAMGAGGHGGADLHTAQGGVALDTAAWRQASGTMALQAESLHAPAGKAGEQKVEADFAQLMNNGIKGPSIQAARTDAPAQSATLATPVYSPDFAQALADQVSMWVGQASIDGPMTAELHLNPAEMGPINVKISLDGQSAQVDFAAAAVETRKAIEASMPLLSNALDSVGLSLTGAGVSDQTAQQGFGQQFAQANAGRGADATGRGGRADSDARLDGDVALRPVSAPRPGRLGGLDLYA